MIDFAKGPGSGAHPGEAHGSGSLALPLYQDPRPLEAVPTRAPHDASAMLDSHGRIIRDLRMSITDRCNFRCVYCMDPEQTFAPSATLMNPAEIARIAGACVRLGVRKIRITGGEPTVRSDLVEIITRLRALGSDLDLAMTTNGSLCDPASLAAWRRAGLNRLTFSLDSLDPERFAALTRSRVTPAAVLSAIEAARAAGFAPLKVNAVVIRGCNDAEVGDLAELALTRGLSMRFIEFMPLDASRTWDRARMVPAAEIVARIAARFPIELLGRDGGDDASTAKVYGFVDAAGGVIPGAGTVGVIAPITAPFCGACQRLRVTADGKVRPCLFSTQEWDILGLLRAGATDADLGRRLIDATWTKQPGHGIGDANFAQPARPMSAIGG